VVVGSIGNLIGRGDYCCAHFKIVESLTMKIKTDWLAILCVCVQLGEVEWEEVEGRWM
jgi:hypothetical protein